MSILKPIEGFVHVEAAGGVVLVLAAAVALVWANSPWGDAYEHLWETHVSIGLGSWAVDKSLHFWINELLMTVFFLVVGLEIKREIFEGALSNVKAAILPIGAAVGGMVVPALIYLALNATGPGSRGWGIAMATDIAFAVGVLTLLGNRIHPALRVLLLALAIIDDIGAILVIALFYSSGFQIAGLAWAASGYLVLVVLLKTGVRSGLIFIPPFLVIWAGFLMMGIHPTIAGVIVGLTAPARSWFGKEGFVEVAQEALDEFRERTSRMHRIDDLFGPLNRLGTARREALSPALRLQVGLHPWVAFAIIPLFALANAGVRVSDVSFGDVGSVTVFWGIVIGLALGKPLGVLLASWVAIRSGGHRLPEGITWPGITVVGGVAGIGFTMAIFIAELAFREQEFLGLAKLAVLIGSGVAATAGLVMGRFALSGRVDSGETLSEMESAEYWVGTDSSPN